MTAGGLSSLAQTRSGRRASTLNISPHEEFKVTKAHQTLSGEGSQYVAEAQDDDESDSHTNSKSDSKSASVGVIHHEPVDDDIHKEIEKFEDEDWNEQVDGIL
jgi:hypothetical protein